MTLFLGCQVQRVQQPLEIKLFFSFFFFYTFLARQVGQEMNET